jgi:hypothetical protein
MVQRTLVGHNFAAAFAAVPETELIAIHLSHLQAGARVTLPAVERTLSIPSFPWGNE